MVSVLPAHIALEMKTEMLRKTCKAQMKSMLDSEKFYSQNETNVRLFTKIKFLYMCLSVYCMSCIFIFWHVYIIFFQSDHYQIVHQF